MAATWFKGVQHRICLDYNDTLINYFINALQIPIALSTIATIATIATCTPEQITAELTSMTNFKKQVDLYLYRRKLDRDFAGGSVLFYASKMTAVTKRVRTESLQV